MMQISAGYFFAYGDQTWLVQMRTVIALKICLEDIQASISVLADGLKFGRVFIEKVKDIRNGEMFRLMGYLVLTSCWL